MDVPDDDICRRIRSGDRSAVDEVFSRDHPAAQLLAQAAIAGGPVADRLVQAWDLLITDILSGAAGPGLRAALLARVIDVLDDSGELDDLDDGVIDEPYSFLPSGDPWEGWWDDEPPEWPSETTLTDDLVLSALRRVPLNLRVLLVLRDATVLSAADAAPIVHCDAAQQAALLDTAREMYVRAIDNEVTGADASIGR